MSRRSEGQLFIGRLGKNVRTRELEDIFERYGRLSRCEIKYGAEMAYAFVDYEDRRDAEDAVRFENGREVAGSSIIVEWAKGTPRRPMTQGYDECYKCHRVGHWARDCPDDRYYGYRRPRRGGGGRGFGGRSREAPRRRRGRSYSRSRSRDRDRKRRRSRTRSRSRSRTPRRRPSRSHSRSRSPSASGSKSRSPSKSRSRSNTPNGMGKRSMSRSKSRSVDREESPGEESD